VPQQVKEFTKFEGKFKEEAIEFSKANSMNFEKLKRLVSPPRGGSVERDRMTFYWNRATQTRCFQDQDGKLKEKPPSIEFLKQYRRAMAKLFRQRPPPKTINFEDVFDPVTKNLRLDVFARALTHIDQTSTPGWPFIDYEENRDVPKNELYDFVNATLQKWNSYNTGIADIKTGSDFIGVFTKVALQHTKAWWMLQGYNWPAKVFVKGEATDEGKVARLIYGLSIVMNVISVILFGDYIRSLPDSWTSSSHKIGMDFQTEEGLAKITMQYNELLQTALARNMSIKADDIQGWEYQGRNWMLVTWHSIYLTSIEKPSAFQLKMSQMYCAMELRGLVIDSDGYIHDPPFYMVFSGKRTTHIENSDCRGALREVDAGTVPLVLHSLDIRVTGIENGDDSLGLNDTYEKSTNLGFVHTDEFTCTPLEFRFSSQVFFRTSTQDDFKRKPEVYQKLLFNYLNTDDISAKFAIAYEFKHSELFPLFERMLLKDLQSAVQ